MSSVHIKKTYTVTVNQRVNRCMDCHFFSPGREGGECAEIPTDKDSYANIVPWNYVANNCPFRKTGGSR